MRKIFAVYGNSMLTQPIPKKAVSPLFYPLKVGWKNDTFETTNHQIWITPPVRRTTKIPIGSGVQAFGEPINGQTIFRSLLHTNSTPMPSGYWISSIAVIMIHSYHDSVMWIQVVQFVFDNTFIIFAGSCSPC